MYADFSVHFNPAETHLEAYKVHRLYDDGWNKVMGQIWGVPVQPEWCHHAFIKVFGNKQWWACNLLLPPFRNMYVQDIMDVPISTKTTSGQLVASALLPWLRLKRLPPEHRCQYLQWWRGKAIWMMESHRVVIADDSRFCFSSASRRVQARHKCGESNLAAIVDCSIARQRNAASWFGTILCTIPGHIQLVFKALRQPNDTCTMCSGRCHCPIFTECLSSLSAG